MLGCADFVWLAAAVVAKGPPVQGQSTRCCGCAAVCWEGIKRPGNDCCAVLRRVLCFTCVNYLVTSSLVRNKPAAGASVPAWLDKVVRTVLLNARKGAIQMKDQQVCLTASAVPRATLIRLCSPPSTQSSSMPAVILSQGMAAVAIVLCVNYR